MAVEKQSREKKKQVRKRIASRRRQIREMNEIETKQ